MNHDEVRSVLGEPKTTTAMKEWGDLVEIWSYWSRTNHFYGTAIVSYDNPYMAGSQNRLSVTFRNGELESWGDQYDYTRMMDQTMGVTSRHTAEISRNMAEVMRAANESPQSAESQADQSSGTTEEPGRVEDSSPDSR